MRIYLIRHGQTTGDLEDRYGGDYEDHLTEEGKKQSQKLANKLKNKDIEVIFHSPRIRAVETAKIVSEKLNIKLIKVQDLRERNAYGILTGMVKSQAKKKYPQEVEKLQKDKLYHDVKNSEDYNSFKKRVINIFKEITNKEYKIIAIISHGGPISCIVREVLKLGEFKKLGDCTILEIEKESNFKLISLDGAELENKSYDIVIKKSKIGQFDNGKGVFANRNFKNGEVVIKYNLKPLTKKEFENLSENEKEFTHTHYGTIYLYPKPERYVNHSSHPNTIQDLKKKWDIAKRDIKKGEEITTDAKKDDI